MKPYAVVILSYYRSDQDVGSVRPKSWHKYLIQSGISCKVIYGMPENSENKDLSARQRSGYFLHLLKKIRNSLKLNSAIAEPQNLKLFKFVNDARKYISSQSCEKIVLISTYGPFVTIMAGFIIKVMHTNVVWHVDYRDDWSTNYKKQGILTIFDSMLERYLTRSYDITTTVSKGYVDRISSIKKGKIHVIQNGFDDDEYFTDKNSSNLIPPISIAYTGTLNNWRPGIESFFNAYADLYSNTKKIKCFVAGDVNAKFVSEFSDSVDFLGLIDRNAALSLQKKSDYLIFFDTNIAGELSSKIFEYLGAKKPIIVVGMGEKSGVRSVIEPTGLYIGVENDYTSITKLLTKLKFNQKIIISEPEIKKYTRKVQVQSLIQIYDCYFGLNYDQYE